MQYYYHGDDMKCDSINFMLLFFLGCPDHYEIASDAPVVKHVRKSVNASEILESEKRLQATNVTRWNSQLKMVRSVLRVPDEKLISLDTQTLTPCRDTYSL